MKGSASAHRPGAFSGGSAILSCPVHAPFLKTLAASILDGSIWNAGAPEPHDLPELTIYVPSQAAVQPLKLEFLWQSPNEATFLPRIRVLGEADPLDLFAAYGTRMDTARALALLEKALAVPAAFSELERQIHLSGYALKAASGMRSQRAAPGDRVFPSVPAVSAAGIAREIAGLIDEAHNEAADFARIDLLDAAHSPGSEQLSLQVLRSMRKSWQAHKARAGKLDAQERRNRLMAIEADFIRQSRTPVIVAGSTASIAATMTLMETLRGRDNSAIVLHGLDSSMDATSWAALCDHPEHPQHGLHRLLTRIDVLRESVRNLHSSFVAAAGENLPRAVFLSEALRPSSTTSEWANFAKACKTTPGSPAPGLTLIEAETIQEEAAAIALVLREALETEGQTAALVTPDEKLIGRVRHALSQWGLAGPFQEAGVDSLASRAAAAAAQAKPEDLVELLRCAEGEAAAGRRRYAELIDLGVLRQMWRPSSMLGIPVALARAEHAISSGEARHPAMKRIASTEWEAARHCAEGLLEALSPLASQAGERLTLKDWTSAHATVMGHLAGLGFEKAVAKEDERSTLADAAKVEALSLTLDGPGYASFFAELCNGRSRAGGESPHPRLFLWTPLDARLLTAGVIVLGGLNEGSWPRLSGPSPWLNGRDRAFVGLSTEERRIGRAAHDFAALAAVAPRVVLTRARKVNGSLTRPSRWVSRMMALASGAGKAEALAPDKPWLFWTRSRRKAPQAPKADRPAPRPPLAARPRRLSVTAIETWIANPYAIFARHILGLDPLRGIGETDDARAKGILYHAALHRFFQAHPGSLPERAADELVRCLDRAAEELGFNLENAPFWRPRFARFAEWFTGTESERRANMRVLKSETGGKLRLDGPAGPFEVTARADRIDILGDGLVRIYDFKTSANAAKTSIARDAPQLALEGLLAREGAFAGIAPGAAVEFAYIVATGGEPPGEVVSQPKPSAEVIEAARKGLLQCIARFDDPATPYAYEARAIYRDKADHDAYAHLGRVDEWSAGAEDSEACDG